MARINEVIKDNGLIPLEYFMALIASIYVACARKAL